MNESELEVELDNATEPEAVIQPEPVAVEPEPVVEVVPEPVKEEPKSKYKEPKAVSMEEIQNYIPEPAGPAVVSNGVVDDVKLSAVIYKNLNARKSLTVHHLQRRLVELGYELAGKDKDGWYGDYTLRAVTKFQTDKKIGTAGTLDEETFLAIFKGDLNVKPSV